MFAARLYVIGSLVVLAIIQLVWFVFRLSIASVVLGVMQYEHRSRKHRGPFALLVHHH